MSKTKESRSAGKQRVRYVLTRLVRSETIRVIESSREFELEALTWMRKFAGQCVSFTDCVSFSLMQRRRIRTAFTFNRHFKIPGFNVIGLK